MELDDACRSILGERAANAIIADQGLLWAIPAAMAAARSTDHPDALAALRQYVLDIRKQPS